MLHAPSVPRISQAELLDAILARSELGHHDAHDGKHGHAAVVDFLVPVLLSVAAEITQQLAPIGWIAEVARLLVQVVVFPVDDLDEADNCRQRKKTEDANRSCERHEAGGGLLCPGEAHEVLEDGPESSHHRHAAMLDLRSAKPVERLIVADLAEAQRVEEAQR